jgi:glycosyltransferase involved in cell wall biosynthesis
MRVLVVHNRYRSAQPSGENAVVDEETELLAEHGCDVARLELDSDAIADWSLLRRAALPGRVVWSLSGYRATAEAIRRTRPDVVHFHNTFPLFSPSALWAARRSGTPVVQTLHNFRALCPAATFMRDGRVCESCLGRLPLPAVRHGCYRGSRSATASVALLDGVHAALGTWRRCVDVFVAVSGFMRAKYVQAGWPAGRIVVKYNTVRAPGGEAPERDGRFVCISRLSAEKGVGVLLDAWQQAFPGGDVQLSIVGAGEQEAELRDQAASLPGVEVCGFLPRAATLRVLAGARAAVVPSLSYEGFPRVVAEAFSLGVPVVASRLGSLPEIVEHGRTGLLVEPASPAALAAPLRLLAASGTVRDALGSEARAAFAERFSPERTTRQLVDIYERCLVEAR